VFYKGRTGKKSATSKGILIFNAKKQQEDSIVHFVAMPTHVIHQNHQPLATGPPQKPSTILAFRAWKVRLPSTLPKILTVCPLKICPAPKGN